VRDLSYMNSWLHERVKFWASKPKGTRNMVCLI